MNVSTAVFIIKQKSIPKQSRRFEDGNCKVIIKKKKGIGNLTNKYIRNETRKLA